MKKFVSLFSLILAISSSFLYAVDNPLENLFVFREDIVVEERDSDWQTNGVDLYIRKKDGMESVMLVETTKDPDGKMDSFAYRAEEYNSVNGDEIRYLNGEVLKSEYAKYSLISSTVVQHPKLDKCFHIYIPRKLVYGYPWERHGSVTIDKGFFINIRTFSKKYCDYSGNYADNPFMFDYQTLTTITKREKPRTEAPKKVKKQKVVEKKEEPVVKPKDILPEDDGFVPSESIKELAPKKPDPEPKPEPEVKDEETVPEPEFIPEEEIKELEPEPKVEKEPEPPVFIPEEEIKEEPEPEIIEEEPEPEPVVIPEEEVREPEPEVIEEEPEPEPEVIEEEPEPEVIPEEEVEEEPEPEVVEEEPEPEPEPAITLTDEYDANAASQFNNLADRGNGMMMYSKGADALPDDLYNLVDSINPKGDVDIVFAIDATGSMKDDLESLKKRWVPMLMEQLNDFSHIRLGLLFYRDYKDDYMYKQLPVKLFAFTDSAEEFKSNIESVRIRGSEGGDIPEPVYEALYASLKYYNWRDNATKKIILIGDAAPHSKPRGKIKVTQDSVMKLAEEMNVSVDCVIVPDGNSKTRHYF